MSASRRRDRHGRGVRGRLVPPAAALGARTVGVPLWRSRQEAFEDLVLDALRPLLDLWSEELGPLDVSVEDVPPPLTGAEDGLVTDGTPGGDVPLTRGLPATPDAPARLVVYRRPVELRAEDRADLRQLVRELVLEAVAEVLGRDPDELDPGEGGRPRA